MMSIFVVEQDGLLQREYRIHAISLITRMRAQTQHGRTGKSRFRTKTELWLKQLVLALLFSHVDGWIRCGAGIGRLVSLKLLR
jgi:hypothetical protein